MKKPRVAVALLTLPLLAVPQVACTEVLSGRVPDPTAVVTTDEAPTSAAPGSASGFATVDISQAVVDRTAGGELVDIDLGIGLSTLQSGHFYFTDPFGNLVSSFDSSHDLAVQSIASSDATDFGNATWVGRAAVPTANGSYGEVAFNGETLVWQSRSEPTTWLFDTYDVFAMRQGSEPIRIGQSHLDDSDGLDGESTHITPGSERGLTIAEGRAWWIDRPPVTKAGADWIPTGYSAPLDGSEPQVESIPGASLLTVDTCGGVGSTVLVYRPDPATAGGEARVLTASPDASGSITDSVVLWERDNVKLQSFDKCADASAVAYTEPVANDNHRGFVDVSVGGKLTTITMGNLSSAGRVTVVPRGVFFFNWGVPDRQYYWSNRSQTLFDIGQGLSFGTESNADGTRVVMAEVHTVNDDGSSDYSPRIVGFAP